MIDIEKLSNDSSVKASVEHFDTTKPEWAQAIVLIAIAEQLKRIADVMEAQEKRYKDELDTKQMRGKHL